MLNQHVIISTEQATSPHSKLMSRKWLFCCTTLREDCSTRYHIYQTSNKSTLQINILEMVVAQPYEKTVQNLKH
jgi:hypothetical protein